MPDIAELIDFAVQNDCSDIHLDGSLPVIFRRQGKLTQSQFTLTEAEIEKLILSLLTERQKERLAQGADLDFSFEVLNNRQRVNIYRQKGRLCAAIRVLSQEAPSLEKLGLPPILEKMADEPRGLLLVTGPTGSGKSTTLAAMINRIKQGRSAHIITIEDPIEYV